MVIENSVQKPDLSIINPESDEESKLSDISRTGGIINAYAAIKLAASLKGERKVIAEKKGF